MDLDRTIDLRIWREISIQKSEQKEDPNHFDRKMILKVQKKR